jgi:hypothetical protein
MMAAFNDSFYDIATPVQPAQTASRHFYSLALFRIKFVLVSHEVTVADQRGIISASQWLVPIMGIALQKTQYTIV